MSRSLFTLVVGGALALSLTTWTSAPAEAAPPPPGAGVVPPVRAPDPSRAPAWLGISMQPDPTGAVLVTQVMPTSPAESAGVKRGDRLRKVAGVSVAQPVDVQRQVGARGVGDALIVTLDRDGREVILNVTLAERPSPDALARAAYVGKPAPNLVGLVSVNGPALSTDGLKNRVVVVDFWAIWCGPCRQSMPALSSLQSRYGAQGLSVLSISTDPVERAGAFARDLGLRTTVAVDKDGETSQLYGVSVLPTTFVVDRRGIVRDVMLGYDRTTDARLESLVRSLLAEPAPTPAPSASSSSSTLPSKPAADAGH